MTKRSFSKIEHREIAVQNRPLSLPVLNCYFFMFFEESTCVSHVLFVSVVRQFQFVQNIECQTHDHTNNTGQYHTCQLNASELYGNA